MSPSDDRYLIRTNQGDKGPFSRKQIKALVQSGQLKPNLRIMDAQTNHSILVAQIIRELEGGENPPPPLSTFAARPQIPTPISSGRQPADDAALAAERQRATQAFSRKDLAAEIADIDFSSLTILGTPSSSDNIDTEGDASGSRPRPRAASSRRGVAASSSGRQTATSGGRRRRNDSGSRADHEQLEEEDFDDDEAAQPTRRRRKQRRGLVLGLIILAVGLILAGIVLMILLYGPKRPYANPAKLPGYWHTDLLEMATGDPPRKVPSGLAMAEIAFTPAQVTMPDKHVWNYDVAITDNGRRMQLILTSESRASKRPDAHFEGETLWMQIDGKWIAFAPGPFPPDARGELVRVRDRIGHKDFNTLIGDLDTLLQDRATR